MSYSKSVIVLKQVAEGYSQTGKTISGIARIERDGEQCDFYLSIINLIAVNDARYHLLLCGKDGFCYYEDLGARPISIVRQIYPSQNLNDGFAVAIAFVKDNLPQIVAFSKTENFSLSLTDIRKTVAERFYSIVKKDVQKQRESQKNLSQKTELLTYDDEAVATENYYQTELELNQKLLALKEMDVERLHLENELSDCARQKETQETKANSCSAQNEKNFSNQKQPEFYLQIKDKLEDIFLKFPSHDLLCHAFPDSRWAKIHFSLDKHYVVGEVKEEGRIKYICYGVPAVYGDVPPKQLSNYCSFIPLSMLDTKGKGYFMTFQDAVSGKCIPVLQEQD
ncbi:MAG: hypothetical protein II988_01835 [Clostridia bacterium]|nr:hypothetical protein [Clostridia bacterium]